MRSYRDSHVGGAAKFFSITVGQESLMAYYMINFNLSLHYKYSLDELDNMIPWERKIYLAMLETHIREKNQEIQRQMAANGQGQRVEHPG